MSNQMRLGQRDDPKGSCSPSILSLQRSIPVHLTYDLIYMCVCVCVCVRVSLTGLPEDPVGPLGPGGPMRVRLFIGQPWAHLERMEEAYWEI